MATIKLTKTVTVGFSTARTVLSAEREIIGAFVDIRWYGIDHPSTNEWVETIEAMTHAIHDTTGEATESIIARLGDRIERSFKAQVKQSDAHWGALRAAQPHLDELMTSAEVEAAPNRQYTI